MKILVLVKQVPDTLDPRTDKDAPTHRPGTPMRVNPADECALEAALQIKGASVSVMSMCPAHSRGALKELISRGAEKAYLLSDDTFAGSDTLATSRTIKKAVEYLGGFDLILAGRRAIDGETGQVPSMLAAGLGIPVITNATDLKVEGNRAVVTRLADAGREILTGPLPMVVSFCEWTNTLRLPSLAGLRRAAKTEITVLDAKSLDLLPSECGLAGSPTRVISSRCRTGLRHVKLVSVKELIMSGVLFAKRRDGAPSASTSEQIDGTICVVCEPGGENSSELIGRSLEISKCVRALCFSEDDVKAASAAHEVTLIKAPSLEDDAGVARILAEAVSRAKPMVVLAAATVWGRSVLPYAAALVGSGMTADTTELSVAGGRLLQTRPAYAEQLIADIVSSSSIQFATVRPGVYPPAESFGVKPFKTLSIQAPEPVIKRLSFERGAHDSLNGARLIVAGGRAVGSNEGFERLGGFAANLGGVAGASRIAVDMGFAPYSMQIGLTGKAVRPDVYIAVGISGAAQHVAGFSQGAGWVIAINNDPNAAIFDYADYGIVGDWREIIDEIERSIL